LKVALQGPVFMAHSLHTYIATILSTYDCSQSYRTLENNVCPVFNSVTLL
jgi:hypothetical protein